jgi:pimeloyl-ACP methyl ester carboxylesterase
LSAELEPTSFEVEGEPRLAGEEMGEGSPVVLLHGISATRRYSLHDSKALARRGHRQVSYDARGHGESEPAPGNRGYGYPELVSDL